MLDQEIREVAKPDQTRPMRIPGSSLKKGLEASGDESRKKRAMSGRQSVPPPIKRKLSPVPSDPKKLRVFGLPSMFRNNPHLPAYTLDGEVRYGVVEPSDEYLKSPDEAPAKKDSNIANGSTPQTPQAGSSSTAKNQFGFMLPIKFRLFDGMNAKKRKRWSSPEFIRNPMGESYGLGEVEVYGNAEENGSKIAGQQPGKVRRTNHLQNFGSQGTANSASSRPCTSQQSNISKTPIPITNKAGSFKVPSPSDSDWSGSQSEDEEYSKAASKSATGQLSTVTNPGSNSQSQLRANAALPAATAAVQRLEVNPTAAGQTFEAALDSSPAQTSRPRFTAFKDWIQTASPSVASAVEQMDAHPNVGGAAFQRGLVNQTTT